MATTRLVELSHVRRDGMITYPGLPGPSIGVHLSRADSRARYAEGTEFEITSITMVANTGTYLDAPAHRFAGADRTRPAHTALLGAGIPVVEHLCRLDRLPDTGFRFHAAPPLVAGMGTFPVRAYAVLPAAGAPSTPTATAATTTPG